MKKLLAIFLILFSSHAISDQIQLKHRSIIINGLHTSNDARSKSIALVVHGTRGHQNLEIISSLRDSLIENNIDSMTVNLSYGISDRVNDFLPCDINHNYLQTDSIEEIREWYKQIQYMGYENIYLIGHSRGGLNIIQFFNELDQSSKSLISSIFLLAPVSDDFSDTRKDYEEKYNIDIAELKDENLEINFLGCEKAKVTKKTFMDYYNIHTKHNLFGKSASLISNLKNTDTDVYIITASEDTFVANTHNKISSMKKRMYGGDNIELIAIDGADHFFRDFYFDDLIEIIMDKIN